MLTTTGDDQDVQCRSPFEIPSGAAFPFRVTFLLGDGPQHSTPSSIGARECATQAFSDSTILRSSTVGVRPSGQSDGWFWYSSAMGDIGAWYVPSTTDREQWKAALCKSAGLDQRHEAHRLGLSRSGASFAKRKHEPWIYATYN